MREICDDDAAALSQAVGFDLDTMIYAPDSPVIAGTPDNRQSCCRCLPGWSRDGWSLASRSSDAGACHRVGGPDSARHPLP
jgi:hypothetical protein